MEAQKKKHSSPVHDYQNAGKQTKNKANTCKVKVILNPMATTPDIFIIHVNLFTVVSFFSLPFSSPVKKVIRI